MRGAWGARAGAIQPHPPPEELRELPASPAAAGAARGHGPGVGAWVLLPVLGGLGPPSSPLWASSPLPSSKTRGSIRTRQCARREGHGGAPGLGRRILAFHTGSCTTGWVGSRCSGGCRGCVWLPCCHPALSHHQKGRKIGLSVPIRNDPEIDAGTTSNRTPHTARFHLFSMRCPHTHAF